VRPTVTDSSKLSSNDVLSRLRVATRSLHTLIDTSLPLARRNASVADYADHVVLLHRWMGQLSATLAHYDDAPACFGAASNSASVHMLADDLTAAGLAPSAGTRAIPERTTHEKLDDPAFRWGMQYVIEGSYMGAGFLYKRHAPLMPECPMHFFRHVAAAQPQRWGSFAAQISAAVTGEQAMASAERGAIHAFECFMQVSSTGAAQQGEGDERTGHHA
jgi:heme oxygenase